MAEQPWQCDACAGSGNPISGKPCICGGSGRAVDALANIRNMLVRIVQERDDAREALLDTQAALGRAQERSDERYLEALQQGYRKGVEAGCDIAADLCVKWIDEKRRGRNAAVELHKQILQAKEKL